MYVHTYIYRLFKHVLYAHVIGFEFSASGAACPSLFMWSKKVLTSHDLESSLEVESTQCSKISK